jgi:endonuclease/exonuclease/phosphatase family metal-dependent hydrolase
MARGGPFRRRAPAVLLAVAGLAGLPGCGGDDSQAGSPDDAGTSGAGGTAGGAGGETSAGASGSAGAEPWEPVADFDPAGALCDVPPDYVDQGGDPVHVACALAAGRYSDRDPGEVPEWLRVVAYNVRFGAESAAVVATLATHPSLAGADFLLLSEVARRDLASVPPGLDQAREIATELSMDFVFAVEWDRREHAEQQGEHGLAVLSKYPLGNALLIRHTPLNDWWAEDRRYGGRATLRVDALVGGRRVRLWASHLDTRGTPQGRAEQGTEIRGDAELAGAPAAQLVGGDLNTWTCNPALADCTRPPAAEPVVAEFLAAGWSDGTEGFTGHTQLGQGFFPQRLDWIFYRGVGATPGGAAADAQGSDHFPVWTLIAPP